MKELTNQNKLSTSSGKMRLICPICGIRFERYAAWVRKVNASYCGRACYIESKRVRVIKPCCVCGVEMELTPSNAARISTCGKSCSTLRRIKGESSPVKPQSSAAYMREVDRIAKAGRCAKCGVTHGPWSVMGLAFEWHNGTPSMVSDGELWCRACHLAHASALGAAVKRKELSVDRGSKGDE